MKIYICLAVILSPAFAKPATQETTTEFSLTPTSRSQFKACITKTGEEGRCVHNSYCNDETYKIEVGGNIAESELRVATEQQEFYEFEMVSANRYYLWMKEEEKLAFVCNKEVEWCCSDKNVTALPPKPIKQREVECAVSEKPDCPWCVKLYRNGSDSRKLDSGLFCMGTIIGSNVVLTTGTCMLQAQGLNMWAQVPESADPTAKYIVKFRQVHPEYNSGTRAYDLALFVLDKDVAWSAGASKGACIGIQYPLIGDCVGAGVDDDENVYITPLLVNVGTCRGGSKIDASCGHVIGDYCSLVPGSPIMCRANGGPFVVVGLAKMPCSSDPPKSLLGNLNKASEWLNSHLKGTMGLLEKNYLPN